MVDTTMTKTRSRNPRLPGTTVLLLAMTVALGVACDRARDDADTSAAQDAASNEAPPAGEDLAEAPAPDAPPVSGDAPPRPIPATAVPPSFPIEAVRRDESGTVLLHVPVDAEGVAGPVSLQRSSGSEILDDAAIRAVSAWRFEPARADGRAVAGIAEIPIEFKPAD
jgi:protein TonB